MAWVDTGLSDERKLLTVKGVSDGLARVAEAKSERVRGIPVPTSLRVVYDRRTNAESKTHQIFVLARDRYMGGHGLAERGSSYAAWACTSEEEATTVARWVRRRSDMELPVTVHESEYKHPDDLAHLSIYVVDAGHPALVEGVDHGCR